MPLVVREGRGKTPQALQAPPQTAEWAPAEPLSGGQVLAVQARSVTQLPGLWRDAVCRERQVHSDQVLA